jgi:hypothetical protein
MLLLFTPVHKTEAKRKGEIGKKVSLQKLGVVSRKLMLAWLLRVLPIEAQKQKVEILRNHLSKH